MVDMNEDKSINTVVLCDFGASDSQDGSCKELRGEDQKTNIAWRAPELVDFSPFSMQENEGERMKRLQRGDIYSFGCVVYEVLFLPPIKTRFLRLRNSFSRFSRLSLRIIGRSRIRYAKRNTRGPNLRKLMIGKSRRITKFGS